MKHQILIIGGGTAGISIAAQLVRKQSNLDIAIIEPSSTHNYQPAWTLVGGGTFDFKKTQAPMGDMIPKGVKWIKEYADVFKPESNQVVLKNGQAVQYDFLVVCPGIQIDLDGVEGLRETLGKNNVCSNYIDPEYTWDVLRQFKGGNALFTQAPTVVKCGGAPQKIMYLADDYFAQQKIKDKTNVIYATNGTVIFGIKGFKETLMEVVNRKKINLRLFHKLVKIDGDKKLAYYEITHSDSDIEHPIEYNPNPNTKIQNPAPKQVVIPFDMLHLAPPQSAPDFIKKSPLVYQDGPNKGWLEVDKYTLQHPRYKNVYALGDAAALPTAKTGAAVRKQAPVIVDRILCTINDKGESSKKYNGYTSCPITTGYGKMLLAEFGYDNVPMPDPLISKLIDTTKESYLMWLLKKYGLPFLYWQMMMKGRM